MLSPCTVCGRKREVASGEPRPCSACKPIARMLAALTFPGPWVEFASCAQVDPDLWFPSRLKKDGEPGDGGPGGSKQAKQICAGCEVREECLDYALRTGQKWGVWGGLSERQRADILANKEVA